MRGYNTSAKVAPPLRTAEDNEALIEGLKDGTITCIGTDHAPHSADKKDVEFERAAIGISSIEVAFPLIWTKLVETGRFALSEIVSIMSCKPAELLRIDRGSLSVGKVADVMIFDPNIEKVIEPQTFYSKGKNCPYVGEKLSGWPKMVLREGRVVLKDGKII